MCQCSCGGVYKEQECLSNDLSPKGKIITMQPEANLNCFHKPWITVLPSITFSQQSCEGKIPPMAIIRIP